MGQISRHSGEGEHLGEHPPTGEGLIPPDVEPARARRIIADGIIAAEAGGGEVEDWVAGHIALQLKTGDGSALDMFARSGALTEGFRDELIRDYDQLPTYRRRWVDFLGTYAVNRDDRGPIEGWAEQAHRRDQFHAAWWDRERRRGNRYAEAQQLDRDIKVAQDRRQLIDDDVMLRLLVRIAPNPHSAIARFAVEGRATDDLGQELQELYRSGSEQERRWLNELGSRIAAQGEQSPVPWWRSPADQGGGGAR